MKRVSRKHLALAVALLNCVAFPLLAPQDKAPVANPDSFTMNANTTLSVLAPGVLANDTDQDGDPLTAVLASSVSHGALTFNANGSFNYTPANNFTGTDGFIYQASDGQLPSVNATVTITINPGPINHPPTAFSYIFFALANSPITFTNALAADADGDALTFSIIQPPSHGTVSGTLPKFTYMPSSNFLGDDSFTFVANDGHTNSNIGTVTFHVFPIVSIDNVSVIEGNTVGGVATFKVSIFPATTNMVNVNCTTASGTANADFDYISKSQTLTFSPGVTQQLFQVAIIPDTQTEPDKTFFVQGQVRSFNALFANGTDRGVATGTILDDDTPGLSINDISVLEGNKTGNPATFTVKLSQPSTRIVTVNWATQDGTALASSDYTAASGTLTFSPGFISQTISVSIVHDFSVEPDETFLVRLSNPTNASIGNGIGTCTILNDEVVIIGVTEGIPPEALVKVGERFTYGVKWTHPTRWRLLDTVDIRIIDDEDSALNVRFTEADNTFSLFDPANGKFFHPDAPGSRTHFETDAVVMYLEKSEVIGSGPTGPSVLLNLNLSFKPKAAGRVFHVEAFATDDDGNQQGFDQAGIIGVLRK